MTRNPEPKERQSCRFISQPPSSVTTPPLSPWAMPGRSWAGDPAKITPSMSMKACRASMWANRDTAAWSGPGARNGNATSVTTAIPISVSPWWPRARSISKSPSPTGAARWQCVAAPHHRRSSHAVHRITRVFFYADWNLGGIRTGNGVRYDHALKLLVQSHREAAVAIAARRSRCGSAAKPEPAGAATRGAISKTARSSIRTGDRDVDFAFAFMSTCARRHDGTHRHLCHGPPRNRGIDAALAAQNVPSPKTAPPPMPPHALAQSRP